MNELKQTNLITLNWCFAITFLVLKTTVPLFFLFVSILEYFWESEIKWLIRFLNLPSSKNLINSYFTLNIEINLPAKSSGSTLLSWSHISIAELNPQITLEDSALSYVAKFLKNPKKFNEKIQDFWTFWDWNFLFPPLETIILCVFSHLLFLFFKSVQLLSSIWTLSVIRNCAENVIE